MNDPGYLPNDPDRNTSGEILSNRELWVSRILWKLSFFVEQISLATTITFIPVKIQNTSSNNVEEAYSRIVRYSNIE